MVGLLSQNNCLPHFSVQTFCKLLSSQKDDNWPLPMMYVLCLDLRVFAGKADQHMEHHGGKPGKTGTGTFGLA